MSSKNGTYSMSCSGASCSFTAAYDLVEPSWSAKVTHGLMTSITAVPRCPNAALSSGRSCFWSPENERATKPQPSSIARAHRSIGFMRFASPLLRVLPTSAVAENWPFVSPYTPLFSMT
jgi:hypothetical protein